MIGIMSKQQDEMLRSFGRRFQLLRQEKDLAQTAIAAMLEGYGIKITPPSVASRENKRNVSNCWLHRSPARKVTTVLTDNPAPRDSTDVVPYISQEADAAARLENVAAHGLANGEPHRQRMVGDMRMWVQELSLIWL